MHNMRTPQGPDHESSSKMETEMAGQSAEPAMKVESVSIRRTENGVYVVSCNKVPVKRPKDGGAMAYEPPKDFAFQSFPEAMDYVAQEFGEQAPAEEAAAPAPAEGAREAAPYDEDEALA